MSEIDRNQHLTADSHHHHDDANGSSLKAAHTNDGGYHAAPPLNRAVTPGGHPLDTSQVAFPTYHRKFANPGPLGLFAFASTTLILSFYNLNVRDINHPNVVVGMAISFGGLAQLLAGMWEYATGNTFGATAFTSYGGFWLSYAVIQWPSSGIKAAYTTPKELGDALGIYLAVWGIFTFLMLLGALKSSVALVSVFLFLTCTFFLLAAGDLMQSATIRHAGGAFGLITAFCAYYTGASGLMTPEASYFPVPAISLAGKKRA